MRRFPAFLLLLLSMLTHAAEAPRPNIVFILADDLGYGEVGFMGQTKILTPNVDRLAKEGLVLTRHYCGNAVCAPSRSVLMTGLNPGRAPVRDNGCPTRSDLCRQGDPARRPQGRIHRI